MARRSVNNPRYQKDTKSGSTRRSAASARPRRGAGERGPAKKEPEKKGRGRKYEVVTNPEIEKQRKRWWFFIVAALAAAGALLIPAVQTNNIIASVLFGVWGACFMTALYIEFFTIRKLRKEEIAKRKKEKKGK
jgi:hypothetical protein